MPRELEVPMLTDPRILILCFFMIFLAYALNFPGFARTPLQFVVSITTCFLVDVLLALWLGRKMLVPMSGIVSSFGVFLLTDAVEPFFFFLCAVLAIGSKHFLRVRGRHIFNPNNFGLVILLLSFPDYVASSPFRWGGSLWWTGSLMLLGFSIAIRVKRAELALSYCLAFLSFAFLRSQVLGIPWLITLTPLTGPGMQLFMFFMITDPKTTPSRLGSKIAFGASVAMLDNFFRYMEVRQSPIFALFIISFCYGAVISLVPEKMPDNPWKVKPIAI